MTKLNVIIVNYRTPQLVERCVRSIAEHGVAAMQDVIVVDNASGEGIVDQLRAALPDVRLIASETNGGFGAGINIGLEAVSSEYVLILNPDTYFLRNSTAQLLSLLDADSQIGIAGLDLVYPDGSRQFSARRFYSLLDVAGRRLRLVGKLTPKSMRRHLMLEHWQKNKPFDAEWILGTGFIIRTDLIRKLGGMDERYFLYLEDVDLCARTWCADYRVICVPGEELVHDHQRSSASGPFSWSGRQHLKSLRHFWRKFPLPLFKQPGIDGIRGHASPMKS